MYWQHLCLKNILPSNHVITFPLPLDLFFKASIQISRADLSFSYATILLSSVSLFPIIMATNHRTATYFSNLITYFRHRFRFASRLSNIPQSRHRRMEHIQKIRTILRPSQRFKEIRPHCINVRFSTKKKYRE